MQFLLSARPSKSNISCKHQMHYKKSYVEMLYNIMQVVFL